MPDDISGDHGATGGAALGGGRHPARPSIAERAARRDQVVAGRDRYSALVRALRSGREISLAGRRRSGRFSLGLDWNPVAGRLLLLALAAVVLYLVVRIGSDWLRRESVTTWSGPDATVTSGQKLASCPDAGLVATIDVFPNWVRWQGRVLLRTDFVRPGVIDGVRYIDTGYTQGELHLVQLRNSEAGLAGTEAMVWLPGSLGGYVYRTAPGCE